MPLRGALISSEARRTVSGYLPLLDRTPRMDGRGVEPRSPGCKPGIFPLDQPPIERESSPRESNPRLPDVSRAPCRWTRGREPIHGRDGSRTHRHQPLMLAALPVCLPGRQGKLRAWESNHITRAYEARMSTGPPAIPGPGLEPGSRPHEGQPGARPPGKEHSGNSGRGESRTPTPQGHELLRLARLPVPPPGQDDPLQGSCP
jgi:hypothetical protein